MTRARALALYLALGIAPGSALAQPALPAASASELRVLREELASSDAARSAHGFTALSRLDDEAFDALASRIEGLRGALKSSEFCAALAAFRTAQGVPATTPASALDKGVRDTLASSHTRAPVLAAEWVALVSALEAQRTPEAAELLVGRLLAVDKTVAEAEAPAIFERLGPVALPALIRGRSHPRPWYRALCSAALASQGNDGPGRAVQQDDAHLLAGILTAYGDVLAFDAMPVVVAYVVDERAEVRQAALRTVRRYGRNAIWQLRERYLGVVGKDAPAEWSHERVLSELLREHGSAHLTLYQRALAESKAALAHGDARAAAERLEPALALDPSDEQSVELANHSFAIGERALVSGQASLARAQYARAERLDPDGVDATEVRARLRFLEAEQLAAQGVLDLGRYEQAAALAPKFTLAQATLAELNGEARAHEAWLRRLTAGMAGLLLAAGAVLWLRMRWTRSRDEEPDTQGPATLDSPA